MTRNLAAFWRDGGGPRRDHLGPYRRGVTVVLHPSTRQIGWLMRNGTRGVGGMVLATVRRGRR
jgi:hypothetical protein